MVTKPLGSAAELIAQTGQGMLTGSGWSRDRRPRASLTPGLVMELPSSPLKYQWKVVGAGAGVATAAASLLQVVAFVQWTPFQVVQWTLLQVVGTV